MSTAIIMGRVRVGTNVTTTIAHRVEQTLTLMEAFFYFNRSDLLNHAMTGVFGVTKDYISFPVSNNSMIELSTEMTIADILELGINKLEYRCSISEECASATPPAAVNPFSLMMNPPMNFLPNSCSEKTGVDKVRNEVLKYLRLQGAFFKAFEGALCDDIIGSLTTVLWNLDGQSNKFVNATLVPSLPIGLTFPSHRSLNGKKLPNLNIEMLQRSTAIIARILENKRLRHPSWSEVNADVGLLFDSLSKYIEHLEVALISTEQTRSQNVPARGASDGLETRIIEPVAYLSLAYIPLSNALIALDFYDFVDIQSFSPTDIAQRRVFVRAMAFRFPVFVFRKAYGNSKGTATFLWRIPLKPADRIESKSASTMLLISTTIIPQYHTREMRRLYIKALTGIKLQPAYITAIYQRLTGDDSSTIPTNKNYHKDLTKAIAAGVSISEVQEVVESNVEARTGKYNLFFTRARQLLHDKSGPQERRHGDQLFQTDVLSVNDLIRYTIKSFEDADEPVPAVPSRSWTELQFCPSNPFAKSAARYSCFLGVCHKLQTRQLSKITIDSHYASAIYRLLKEWMILYKEHVVHVCLDDKSTIPVCDPDAPSSAVPRQRKVIVPVGVVPSATDHDFNRAQLVPSVMLVVAVPYILTHAAWYEGVSTVTIKNSIFEASSAMRHAAEVLKNLPLPELSKPVYVSYTDGGPDHRTSFISVILAAIAIWRKGDFDIFVHARTPAGLSIRNPAERVMSVLNIALYSYCVVRKELSNAEEKLIKPLNSKKKWRQAAANNKNIINLATKTMAETIERLEERFARLQFSKESIKIGTKANTSDIEGLFKDLQFLDADYDFQNAKKSEVLNLEAFQMLHDTGHISLTDYVIQIRKCKDIHCKLHKPLRLDIESFDKITWLPLPRLDASSEHYKSLADTLSMTVEGLGLVNPIDQPSLNARRAVTDGDIAESSSTSTKRRIKGTNITTIAGLKVSAAKIRGVVAMCIECTKPRLVYSDKPFDLEMMEAAIGEVDYICGGAILPLSDSNSNIAGTLTGLTCEANVETAYYSTLKKINAKRPVQNYDPLTCFACGENGGALHQPADGNTYAYVLPSCITCHSLGCFCFRRKGIQLPVSKAQNIPRSKTNAKLTGLKRQHRLIIDDTSEVDIIEVDDEVSINDKEESEIPISCCAGDLCFRGEHSFLEEITVYCNCCKKMCHDDCWELDKVTKALKCDLCIKKAKCA